MVARMEMKLGAHAYYHDNHMFVNNNCLLLTLGAHAQRGLQYLVCLSVVFCYLAQQTGKPTASALHWLYLNGDFRKSAQKLWRENQSTC